MSRGNSCELNLWCPSLVLLNQTCFLLLLSGSYGYDRSCWFQAKMIINIRNELPSSCLGSAPKWSLKPPLQKLALGRFFFYSTKWLKAYENGYPIFINNFLKPERVVCSKCQHCSCIKMNSLKLVKSGQFFFHANYRIPDCETKTKYFW